MLSSSVGRDACAMVIRSSPAASTMMSVTCFSSSSVVPHSDTISTPVMPRRFSIATSCRMACSLIRRRSELKVGMTQPHCPRRFSSAHSRASPGPYSATAPSVRLHRESEPPHRQAPIARDDLPRYGAGGRRREEHVKPDVILGRSCDTQRVRLADHPARILRVREVTGPSGRLCKRPRDLEIGNRAAGSNAVDPHVGSELERQLPHHTDDRVLRDGVENSPARPGVKARVRDGEYHAAATVAEVRGGGARREKVSENIDADDLVRPGEQRLDLKRLEREVAVEDPGIRNKNVESAEALDRRGDGALVVLG